MRACGSCAGGERGLETRRRRPGRGPSHGEDRRTHPQWLALLGPARAIVDALRNVCADAGYDPVMRSTAAEALAWALSTEHDPVALANALTTAQPEASLILLRELELLSENRAGLDRLETLAKDPGEPRDDSAVDRQAMAVIALAFMGQPDALRPALRHQIDPGLRTWTIQKIATLRLAPRVLHERLPWHELDGAERQAVLLAWAETPRDWVLPSIRAGVLKNARQSFLDDLDPGVHSAAELLIRRWEPGPLPVPTAEKGKLPGPMPATEAGSSDPTSTHWSTSAVRCVFRMGSPEDELKRFDDREKQHERRIDRSLLVATTETTVKQYQKFNPGYVPDRNFCDNGQCSTDIPAGGISWYEAISYCNWLSREAGLEPFFPEKVEAGTKLPKGGIDRGGFRLPTEAEWEYICRAQTETCRPFGESEQFRDKYVWTLFNSREVHSPTGRLLPNEFGLFDTLGSQWEWCLDGASGSEALPRVSGRLEGTAGPGSLP